LEAIGATVGTKKVQKFKMYIGGEWVDAESGDTFEVVSPVTGEVLAILPNGDREDVKKAVDAAKESKDKVTSIPIPERTKLMYRLTEIINQNKDSFATENTLEQGKPIKESYGELAEVEPNILQQAEDMKRLEGAIHVPILKHGSRILSIWEPCGVFGVITPWNFPWLLPTECVPQAFMAGNSVVFKPAETTPISGIRLVQCMEKAGFPKGTVNMVLGASGPLVGGAIVEHPDVDGICFTGESATGEEITRRAGMKRLILECGGLGPLIVMSDAALDKAVSDTVFGCTYNAGQVCVSNERILVHEKLHDRFVDLVSSETRKKKLGNPLSTDTDVGPLNNEPQVKKIESHVKDGLDKGAKVLVGGRRATGFQTQLYFAPTVVDNVTRDMLFNKEETFGPVAPIITFSNVDEAIDIANSSKYGLSAAIHTKNLRTAFECAERIKTGQVVVNDSVCVWEYQHPWGGMKKSGLGRMGGKYTLQAMMQQKTILINLERSEAT
jgi:succinate-semialdehyde dehydrogenase/glutarate-semialdehyde dehydrogenase